MNEKLNELFDKWRRQHVLDTNYKNNTRKYKNEYICKDNFCMDGFVGECCGAGVSVLFIMKESNLLGYKAAENKFWFKEVYKNNRYKIPRRLRKCAEALGCNYEKCAYMNINKRGGIYNADNRVIKTYFENYKDFIIEEIKIINPEKILIASEELKDIIFDGLKKSFPEIEIYYTAYHPSIVKKGGVRITDDIFKSKLYKL